MDNGESVLAMCFVYMRRDLASFFPFLCVRCDMLVYIISDPGAEGVVCRGVVGIGNGKLWKKGLRIGGCWEMGERGQFLVAHFAV